MVDTHLSNRETQIGNICIQWSALEYGLAAAIWAMVGVDQEVGKILTGNTDAKQRAVMAHALAWETNAPVPVKSAFKEVLTSMRENLIHRRNEAVHGIHFGGADSPIAEIEMHRGKGGRGPRQLSNESLAQLGREINAATTKVNNATIALIRAKMAALGKDRDYVLAVADILRNSSVTIEEGDTKGPA